MFFSIFTGIRLAALSLIAQAAESPADSFQELGSLFVWGILGAICAAVAVVLIRLRIQSRREAASDYVSINPSRHENQ